MNILWQFMLLNSTFTSRSSCASESDLSGELKYCSKQDECPNVSISVPVTATVSALKLDSSADR
jgi:hypothetical protein